MEAQTKLEKQYREHKLMTSFDVVERLQAGYGLNSVPLIDTWLI